MKNYIKLMIDYFFAVSQMKIEILKNSKYVSLQRSFAKTLI